MCVLSLGEVLVDVEPSNVPVQEQSSVLPNFVAEAVVANVRQKRNAAAPLRFRE